jgi:molybdenum cofactor cytidylyltransferase
MFSSIQCAAKWDRWASNVTHWAIVLGDQPHLKNSTLSALLEFSAAHPQKICQPRHGGRFRHPVVVPKQIFSQLCEASASTLKEFLRTMAAAVVACELDDAGLEMDLDTPEDYARVVREAD